MKNIPVILSVFILSTMLAACAILPAEPTPSDIPPTSTPNPDAERVIMEFGDLFNNKDIEAALALFSEDIHIGNEDSPIKGKDQIEIWLKVNINTLKTSYEFSEVNVEGNEVIWNVIVQDHSGKERCEFNATIQGDLISYLNFRECVEID